MKNKRRILVLIGLAAMASAVLLVNGCNLLGDKVSIHERIDSFFADIDGANWSSVYTNINPDNPLYDSYKADSYWNTRFNAGDSYSYSSYSEGSLSASVTVSSSDASYSGDTWVFTMKEDTPGLWYIDKLENTTDSQFIINN